MCGGRVAECSLSSGLLKRFHPERRVPDDAWVACDVGGALWLCRDRVVQLLGASSSPPASRLVPLTTYPGIEGPPSLSPDGNQVTFERNGDIFVKQVDGEALVQLTSTAAPGTRSGVVPRRSPDRVHARGRGHLRRSHRSAAAERKVADTRAALLLKTMAWTPDSPSLVISEMTSSICASLFVISIETGQKTRLTSPPEPSIGDGWPAVSPDGRTVAFARYSQDTSANIHLCR